MSPMLSQFLVYCFLVSPAYSLWPMPRTMSSGNSTLLLSQQFTISGINNVPQDVDDAISRTSSFLKSDKLGRLVVGRGASDVSSFSKSKQLPGLRLQFTALGPMKSIPSETVSGIEDRDESYELQIPSDGSEAVLSSNSSLGLARGLTTFSQLWYSFGDEIYAIGMPMLIHDSPAYPYRGFMLDTSRNFFPVDDIQRTIDAMSWVKLNTLHWHVVDSQSFPIEIPSFPEVSAKGAYSTDEVYSQTDVQNIISYASARGVDILAEFDTPGHTAVISESHPEHVACAITTQDYDANFANEPPQGQLRFAVPATRNFTASLMREFSSMFPSKLFSTGGDEINLPCYTDDGPTQAALQSSGQTFEQALNVFTQSTHSVLLNAGKTPVVWEEMVLEHNVTLSNNTIAMVWISSANAQAIAAKGFRLVHGPSDYFYLDCGAGEWMNSVGGSNSWCDPFKTWQKVAYSFDPLANLSTDQVKLVLGGEQLLWTEQSGPENLDPITWPRAAVSAEVFWTGATLPDGSQANVEEALPRLHDIRYRMVQRGVRAINLQPRWCAIRPGQCDL